MRIISLLCLIFAAGFSLASGQTKAVKTKMTLEPKTHSSVEIGIFNSGIVSGENEKMGKTPNNLLIRVERDESVSDKFSVWIDKNNNESLADESAFKLSNGEKAAVEVSDSKNLRKHSFEISLKSYGDKFYFYWKNNYQAKGNIRIKNCAYTFYLQDLNANGKFEFEENGTNLQLDRNNDGKIWGKDEHLFSREIIDICGENFLISAVAEDGSFAEFTPTNLQIAKIGEKTPYFYLSFINGKSVSSEQLSGKTYILDFWASWCVPCVAKLPEIKELENKTSVFYINTDDKDRVSMAKEIIFKNNLQNDSVVNGLGESDYLWKTFARINNSLPFYVLIDEKGIIKYAGGGGSDLNELKERISKLPK